MRTAIDLARDLAGLTVEAWDADRRGLASDILCAAREAALVAWFLDCAAPETNALRDALAIPGPHERIEALRALVADVACARCNEPCEHANGSSRAQPMDAACDACVDVGRATREACDLCDLANGTFDEQVAAVREQAPRCPSRRVDDAAVRIGGEGRQIILTCPGGLRRGR